MNPTDTDGLRFLLAGLREPEPSKQAERRALAAFRRLWPAPERRSPGRQGKAGVSGYEKGRDSGYVGAVLRPSGLSVMRRPRYFCRM